jgi:hypothetical protein
VLRPVNAVEIPTATNLVTTNRAVLIGLFTDTHQVQPVVHIGRGEPLVMWITVTCDELGSVEPAALVVEVAPQKNEEVADLDGPGRHKVGGAELGLDRANAGHQTPA